jgi:alkanesulfonate monooxygenase SsuD/methylene tetrahydromethanopterin reductase-like flavin-dependent oxidoreductase (luciferase family)
MAAAATATKSLKVGTGICLVIQRDPIVMAKEVASVDFISGGRVLFGVAGGGTSRRWRITAPSSRAAGR